MHLDSVKIECYNLISVKIWRLLWKNNSYHHGDLKHELMEKGLLLINKYGEDNLSLRKLAAECGVSNAAPYAHFENKEDLISKFRIMLWVYLLPSLKMQCPCALKVKIFSLCLEKLMLCSFTKILRILISFSKKNIKVNVSLGETGENPPFDILKKIASEYFSKLNMPEYEIEKYSYCNVGIGSWLVCNNGNAECRRQCGLGRKS